MNSRPQHLRVVALLAALAVLAGCSAMRDEVKKPEVYVKGVSLTRVGATSADAVFTLNLFNPNDFELPLHGINYDLAVNNRRLLLGDSKQELRLPGGGSGEIPLAVTIEYSRVFDTLSEALRKRRATYQLSGSVGVGPFRLPFAAGGEFALE